METAEHAAVAVLDDHVIIVGYGLNGRNLARALRSIGIRYVILDQHGGVVREAREAGEHILFGDGTNIEVLERVGIRRARVIVFCIAAPDVERRGVAVARSSNPKVHIVVRTRYVRSIDELRRLGANEVVPEEFETSLEIFGRVLRRYGVPASTIRAEDRGGAQGSLRGIRGDRAALRLSHRPGHRARGAHRRRAGRDPARRARDRRESADADAPQRTGATVVAVIRSREVIYEPAADFRFREHDTVVLVGVPEALTRATPLFAPPDGG